MAATVEAGQLFLHKYEALRLLGAGGMGQAYLGRAIGTYESVVIKVMHPGLAADPVHRRRFASEISLLGRLKHANVVRLIDADAQQPERPFMVQEYVAGESLAAIIERDGRLALRRAALLLGQLCQVLHHLHSLGILHRDISAQNIMIVGKGTCQEQLKLMDFGLASLGASDGVYLSLDRLTASEGTIGGGTPDYLAPEQIRKEPIDARSDLYSVGVLLFQMLTGRLPFADAESVEDILAAHLHREPPSFAALGAYSVPAGVEVIVQCLLSKHPQGRPASAGDLAALFGRAMGFDIAPAAAFAAAQPGAEADETVIEDLEVLDRLQAWMPEQIAVMKLRGFLSQVGGEVVESLPGKIRVRILDPRCKTQQERVPGLLGYFGMRRTVLAEPSYLHLTLHLAKKTQGARSLVEIALTLEGKDDADDRAMRRGFAERICRELRAFLMV